MGCRVDLRRAHRARRKPRPLHLLRPPHPHSVETAAAGRATQSEIARVHAANNDGGRKKPSAKIHCGHRAVVEKLEEPANLSIPASLVLDPDAESKRVRGIKHVPDLVLIAAGRRGLVGVSCPWRRHSAIRVMLSGCCVTSVVCRSSSTASSGGVGCGVRSDRGRQRGFKRSSPTAASGEWGRTRCGGYAIRNVQDCEERTSAGGDSHGSVRRGPAT